MLSLPGDYTQAKTLDELLVQVKEALSLYLDVEKEGVDFGSEFVGVQVVEA